jgi:hypothetical protein
MISLLQVIHSHHIVLDYKISIKVPHSSIQLTIGYRHIPLVDLQGEKYIYSTLFVKITWSIQDTTIERPNTLGKLEKRSKAKARLAKMEEASRSGTSIESSESSAFSVVTDEAIRMERAESTRSASGELARIYEVNEAKEK